MKNIATVMPVIALAMGLSAVPVLGQMKDAKPQAAAPAGGAGSAMKSDAAAASRKGSRSMASVDARHCLQLATNMAIHRCAEKYRPR